jgi:hypothetical protein
MARSASVTSPAFLFVMTTGIVNLFGDITYEGGASINGPFMASLGASAARRVSGLRATLAGRTRPIGRGATG